jgi:2-amino-4-hydroxy-6-hydroxymethyldihydropteridine diphosphokinase
MQTAFIGMGSNLVSKAGPPDATLAAAAERLESLGRIVCRSSLYSTEPVGFRAQPRFVNAVVGLETELQPTALLAGLLRIEQEFGRDRSAGIQNGPRTLDLDILFFGDQVIREPGLEVPHPRINDREFVLVPLRELASNVLNACHGTTVTQMMNAVSTPPHGDTNDAVTLLQSSFWRAGVGRNSVGSDNDSRAVR